MGRSSQVDSARIRAHHNMISGKHASAKAGKRPQLSSSLATKMHKISAPTHTSHAHKAAVAQDASSRTLKPHKTAGPTHASRVRDATAAKEARKVPINEASARKHAASDPVGEDEADNTITASAPVRLGKARCANVLKMRRNITRAQRQDRPRNMIRKATFSDYLTNILNGVCDRDLVMLGLNPKNRRMCKSRQAFAATQKVVEHCLIAIANDADRIALQSGRSSVRPTDIAQAAYVFFNRMPLLHLSGQMYGPYASEIPAEDHSAMDGDDDDDDDGGDGDSDSEDLADQSQEVPEEDDGDTVDASLKPQDDDFVLDDE